MVNYISHLFFHFSFFPLAYDLWFDRTAALAPNIYHFGYAMILFLPLPLYSGMLCRFLLIHDFMADFSLLDFLYLLSRSNVMGFRPKRAKVFYSLRRVSKRRKMKMRKILLVKDFLSQSSLSTVIEIKLKLSWITQRKRIASIKGHFTPKFSFPNDSTWCCKENLGRDVFHPTTRSRQITLWINFTILSSSQFLLNPSHSISCALFYIFHFEFW